MFLSCVLPSAQKSSWEAGDGSSASSEVSLRRFLGSVPATEPAALFSSSDDSVLFSGAVEAVSVSHSWEVCGNVKDDK